MKSLLVLLGCVAIAALAWGFFVLFGKHATTILLLITLVSILAKPKKGRLPRKAKGSGKN